LERVSKVSESDLTLRMVSLEWDLSLIWPLKDQMLFTRGSEERVRNWAWLAGGEIFKDGELAAGLLGGEVLDRGEGALLMAKDELANVAGG
jgi:hypothetical protein